MSDAITNDVPGCSLAERHRRWTLAGALMDQRGVDALLTHGEHEDAGPTPFCFDTWFTNDRPGTTVLMRRGAEPVSLVPMSLYLLDRLEAERRGDDVWIPAPKQDFPVCHTDDSSASLLRRGEERGCLVGPV